MLGRGRKGGCSSLLSLSLPTSHSLSLLLKTTITHTFPTLQHYLPTPFLLLVLPITLSLPLSLSALSSSYHSPSPPPGPDGEGGSGVWAPGPSRGAGTPWPWTSAAPRHGDQLGRGGDDAFPEKVRRGGGRGLRRQWKGLDLIKGCLLNVKETRKGLDLSVGCLRNIKEGWGGKKMGLDLIRGC